MSHDEIAVEITDGASFLSSKGEWLDNWNGMLSDLDPKKTYEITWRSEYAEVEKKVEPIAVPVAAPVAPVVSEE